MSEQRAIPFLREALSDGQLVEFQRSVLDCRNERGFVVGMGTKWTLFEVIDDSVRLDGYQAVRTRDIARARPMRRSFFRRALAVSGQQRTRPKGIGLDRTRDVLRTGTEHFRIVAIHREYFEPGVCYIGAARPGKKRLRLDEISPNAKWLKKPRRYRYGDITRIDFDGQYERALLAVVDAEATRP